MELHKRALVFQSLFTTGYFARANEKGHDARSTKVHILCNDGTCMCGYKPHKTMQFQWNAKGIELQYVECPGCKERGAKLLYGSLPKIIKVEGYKTKHKKKPKIGKFKSVIIPRGKVGQKKLNKMVLNIFIQLDLVLSLA